ncbi:glycosyltransferase family 2 protein [Colwellia sp. MB02u-18]|uniref:glycosyltransferase family 2 protein n=1 Tax=unclassified Colwellia TaxID=196834 RepID=UPI0015F707EB|nr:MULTISPECIES: glycosyltransferase family 2 protein [unclassified Colwellia]MBA6224524.1 glycosyltransferase family 2 protein [Colwellia sp. MB3u-45]MBA6268164.1 glycosyltransferase family 2 protein [Colwellia sp. MB3u-43]MBA6322616.1 glycosyltransferase family 2 protein [Colwellia sp. MB02u-19]MBA6326194.1 glycosyltransferase family 2 protein [Colwellia sp. MB02u-18]MBA6331653.1 glycosyltransferase family 2 protein [Colwellia sp. MB02u-12]
MKVSVLIPVYNAEKTIESCLTSVLNQTLKDIEIVVVNDGSSDETRFILDVIAKANHQVKVIHNINKGVSSSRNCLVENAYGEYLLFLDADDWIDKSTCELLYLHASNYNLDIVVSDYYRERLNKPIEYCSDLEGYSDVFSQNKYLLGVFSGDGIVAVWNKLFRRSLFEEVFFPCELDFGEDLATLPRIITKSTRVGKLDKAFVHYVECNSSITHTKLSLKVHQIFDAIDILLEYFSDSSRTSFYRDKIIRYRATHVCHLIFLTPYYQDDNYNKAFYKVLELLKESKSLELFGYSKIQKILVYWLYAIPFEWNLKFTINLIQKVKKIALFKMQL